MDNKLQIFNNPEFGEVRVIEIDGIPYFCGSDIAKALGYGQLHKAIKAHCRKDGGTIYTVIDRLGRKQKAKFIPESDVYRLVIHSKLPAAEAFERWVFEEVLPTIRKHGAYATDDTIENILNDPDFGIKLLTELKNERAEKTRLAQKIEQDKPKVIFAEAVSASDSTILIGDLAKLLQQNGYKTGQKRLFEQLRQEGYLMKVKGSSKNMPTQTAMEKGLFEIKETVINNPNGKIIVQKTPKVTGKGQEYFLNRFLAGKNLTV